MVVAIDDVAEAEQINDRFDDVLAWVQSIEAQVFPGTINETLVNEGREVFASHCASCHGNYEDDTYPSLLVELSTIGTDPYYARYFQEEDQFITALKESWIGESSLYDDYINAPLGYVAPPLDGIWATAPYLHNGSVPDLASLLESELRPTFWRRNFASSEYNLENVG